MNLNEYLMNKNKNMDDYVCIFWIIINFAVIFSKHASLSLYVHVLSMPLMFLSLSLKNYKDTVLGHGEILRRLREDILLHEENLRLQKKYPFPIKPIPSSGQECPIAHDEIPTDENCYILHCGHTFGEGIVQWWDNGNRTCPMCRRVIERGFLVKMIHLFLRVDINK